MAPSTHGTKDAKFWFDLDGKRYGARFLSIAENAACSVEIDRHTAGKYAEWLREESMQMTAMTVYAAAYLSRLICQWPVGEEPIDFLNHEDVDLVLRYWEAYQVASERFRNERAAGPASVPVAG